MPVWMVLCMHLYISHVVTCSAWNIVRISCLSTRSVCTFFSFHFNRSLCLSTCAIIPLVFSQFIIGSLNAKTNNCLHARLFLWHMDWMRGCVESVLSTRNTLSYIDLYAHTIKWCIHFSTPVIHTHFVL